ncbi:MAG: HAD hydrolase-like protein [Clostridia bacterium]|nr:HAD hydrolase-like protein [Clostridia bacterium]
MDYSVKPKMILFDVGGTIFDDGKCSQIAGLSKLRALAENPEVTTDEELLSYYEECLDELDFNRSSKNGDYLEIPLPAPIKYATMKAGLKFKYSITELEELFDRYNSTREYVPGIRTLLPILDELGIRAAVISNNMMTGESLALAIKHWLPESNMEFCFTSADTLFSKPSKKIFDVAVGYAGLNADECWYCGDGKVPDVDGGSGAGLHPVLIDVKSDKAMEMRTDCENGEYMTVNNWEVLASHLKTL